MPELPYDATLVITSRNRKQLLRGAVASALRQTARLEIVVLDDGSEDGSSDMVRAEFPHVLLHRFETSAGLIQRRNDGAKLASAPVVFSIDDDAEFPSPRTVEQTLRDFNDERIGAVAIPFVDINRGPQVRQHAPGVGAYVADSFIGTAHAIRRDLFLRLGGYRASLVHQGEEMDLCIRLIQAGFLVRLGTADPIHHFESPRRDFRRMDFFGRRNDILFAWNNVPFPSLLPHLAGTTFNGLRLSLRTRRAPWPMWRGIVRGYWCALTSARNTRAPVSPRCYRLFRELKKRPMPLAEAVNRLPES